MPAQVNHLSIFRCFICSLQRSIPWAKTKRRRVQTTSSLSPDISSDIDDDTPRHVGVWAEKANTGADYTQKLALRYPRNHRPSSFWVLAAIKAHSLEYLGNTLRESSSTTLQCRFTIVPQINIIDRIVAGPVSGKDTIYKN